jgi:hypothetical protein
MLTSSWEVITMTSLLVFQIAYPRQREELRDKARVTAWLEALAAQGYYVTQENDPFYDQWAEALRTHSIPPGVSTSARENIRIFCAGEADVLGCKAYSLAEDFTDGVDLSYPDGFVFLSADDGYFTFDGPRGQHKYELFIDLVEASYHIWHPIYSFLGESSGVIPHTSREEALALEPRWLYDINLFGPEYVQKIGRERLLSAPAWKVKELDDGGILIVPAPYVEVDWHNPSPYKRPDVAQHLDIPFDYSQVKQVRGQ